MRGDERRSVDMKIQTRTYEHPSSRGVDEEALGDESQQDRDIYCKIGSGAAYFDTSNAALNFYTALDGGSTVVFEDADDMGMRGEQFLSQEKFYTDMNDRYDDDFLGKEIGKKYDSRSMGQQRVRDDDDKEIQQVVVSRDKRQLVRANSTNPSLPTLKGGKGCVALSRGVKFNVRSETVSAYAPTTENHSVKKARGNKKLTKPPQRHDPSLVSLNGAGEMNSIAASKQELALVKRQMQREEKKMLSNLSSSTKHLLEKEKANTGAGNCKRKHTTSGIGDKKDRHRGK